MRLAEHRRDQRLAAVIARLAAPLRVAVVGRSGVGRDTVAAALAAAGVAVTTDAPDADVQVLVIAEVLKPEDRAVLAAAETPMVTVLNKADLTGLGDGGPLPRAYRRASDFLAAT